MRTMQFMPVSLLCLSMYEKYSDIRCELAGNNQVTLNFLYSFHSSAWYPVGISEGI